MFTRLSTAAFLSCAALTLGTPAFAQQTPLINGNSMGAIENILSGYGSVTADTDGEGDPMFNGRISGDRYSLFFYGCDDDHENCTSATFSTYFDGDVVNTDLNEVNAFNDQYRFGKAAIDSDGDLSVDYSISFFGGLTEKNFDDLVDWWRIALSDIHDHFSF
nr:YbjN domain-containing protein [uncultured Celeribacter sp.]